MVQQHIELFFKEGGSDKVYQASIIEEGIGFVVNFNYGRRGNALTTGTKTAKPVALEQAQKIYNKLIQEKTAKGYQEDPEGKPFSGTLTEARDTGFRPQLLNEIEEEEVVDYIYDPEWCAQEKFDGRRRSIITDGSIITATNRKGLSIPLDKDLETEVGKLIGLNKGVLDGEDMGDRIIIFDIPVDNLPYSERHAILEEKFKTTKFSKIELIYTAWTTLEKRELYKRIKEDNAEGIVFKRIEGKYKPGRPASGGDQLKFKFCDTATCKVVKVSETKRSIQLAVFDEEDRITEVGNVTVYPNQNIPKVGTIVEVKYLYYFPGGSLFQPVLLGERDDMTSKDCTLKQLKNKREE